MTGGARSSAGERGRNAGLHWLGVCRWRAGPSGSGREQEGAGPCGQRAGVGRGAWKNVALAGGALASVEESVLRLRRGAPTCGVAGGGREQAAAWAGMERGLGRGCGREGPLGWATWREGNGPQGRRGWVGPSRFMGWTGFWSLLLFFSFSNSNSNQTKLI